MTAGAVCCAVGARVFRTKVDWNVGYRLVFCRL